MKNNPTIFTPAAGEICSDLMKRIDRGIALYHKERLFIGLLRIAILISGIFLLAGITERLFFLGIVYRGIIFWLMLLAVCICFFWFVLKPLFHQFHLLRPLQREEFALMIGSRFPVIKDRLRNVLQLHTLHDEFGYSPMLVEESFHDLHRASADLDFSDVVSFDRVKKYFHAASIAVLVTGLLFGFQQTGFASAFYRIVHWKSDFRPPAPFRIIVSPGNKEVVRGESVAFLFTIQPNTAEGFSFRMPASVRLIIAAAGVTDPDEFILLHDSTALFSYTIPVLKNTIDYYASADGVTSEKFRISVAERPMVRSIKITIIPPPYSLLPPQEFDENMKEFSALKGSAFQFALTPGKPVARAKIVFTGGKVQPFTQKGTQWTGSSYITESVHFHFELEDKEGIASINPIDYSVRVIPDEYPQIAIIEPGKNVDIVDQMQLPLQMKISDDFGFSKMILKYRLVQSRYEQPQEQYAEAEIPLEKRGSLSEASAKEQMIEYAWDVKKLGLVPEDVVEYFAEIRDNDAVSGPKSTKSASFLLRLPSMEEVLSGAEKVQTGIIKELERSLKSAEEMKKDLDDLSREMKKNLQPEWQKQKSAEELTKKYGDLQKKIEQAAKSVEQMTGDLQKNNLLSGETLDKYMELQKLFSELNMKELQDAMKKMQSAMQSVSPEQMKEAMKQAQFSEENFRKSIERTLNLLKRIQVEQKTDELIKRAEEIEKLQESIEKESAQADQADGNKMKELAQRQQDAKQKLESLRQELGDLRKKMEEFPKEMPLDALEKSEESAGDPEMDKAMDESAKQLGKQQPQNARQQMQRAGKKIKQMKQSLSEMQQQLLTNQMTETMKALRKAMKEILTVSQEEEGLKKTTMNLDQNSPGFREQVESQLDIQSELNAVADGLAELSQKSFAVTPEMGKAIGEAMAHMSRALGGLNDRNGQSSAQEQQAAMASLNKAASQVQSAMQSMQQGGSGGGGSLLQQMQKLSAQQQGINMQSQQLGSQQGMSQEQMQSFGRLAAQQEAVRKSLEQLNKEAQQSGQKDRIMGDLQNVADEMREVIRNLEQQNINSNTMQQQERILSRMLDAQNSMRERDYEQRRKAVAAGEKNRISPAELNGEQRMPQLRKDLIKALEQGYTKEYQELIRKYFDELGKVRKEN